MKVQKRMVRAVTKTEKNLSASRALKGNIKVTQSGPPAWKTRGGRALKKVKILIMWTKVTN